MNHPADRRPFWHMNMTNTISGTAGLPSTRSRLFVQITRRAKLASTILCASTCSYVTEWSLLLDIPILPFMPSVAC